MRLADLADVLQPLVEGTYSEPFITLCFAEDGALIQFLYEDEAFHLYLNTSGDGGSLDELRAAVEGLGVEVRRLDGHAGTEHVTLRGPVTEVAQGAIQVLSAVFEKSRASEIELLDAVSDLEREAGAGGVSMRRPLAVSSLGLLVAGGLAVGFAMVHSRTLTGQWLGSPLPTPTEVALGLGSLGLVFGAGIGMYWALLQLAERTALAALLHKPLVGEGNRLARAATRFVRGVISLSSGLRTLWLLGAAVLVLWLAVYDARVAWVLGVTAGALGVVYWLRRRSRSE